MAMISGLPLFTDTRPGYPAGPGTAKNLSVEDLGNNRERREQDLIDWLGERCVNVRSRSAHPQETVSAIDRATLRRLERHRRLYCAKGTLYRHLNTFTRECLTIGLHIGGNPFVLLDLAWLASLGIVFQTFISKKQLLSCCKDKLLLAIHAPEHLIRILVHSGPPKALFHPGGRRQLYTVWLQHYVLFKAVS